MREESLIRRVESLITSFDYNRPFSMYLREHFRMNPQMGSTDRRMTREWCYNYFRIGKAVPQLTFRSRLIIGCFLCNNLPNAYLSHLLKDSVLKEELLNSSLELKLSEVKKHFPEFRVQDIFQMLDHLSDQIPHTEWLNSLLLKPRVWIRIRKQFLNEVMEELNKLIIPFVTTDDTLTISFLQDVQLEKTNSYQKGFFEIQDVSSQRTSKYFRASNHEKWWDACAGSGGKSLMLLEQASDIQLIATDIRPAILTSYAERMRKAGHHNFETHVLDFDPPGRKQNLNLPAFDGVIADVPCSGSGTWQRSPEWYQVDMGKKLKNHFIPLQRTIVARNIENLKPGKPLIYITCSVFKEENEENIRFFESDYQLNLEKFEYMKGFGTCADTLFVARFIRK